MSPSFTPQTPSLDDSHIWKSLKQAIATSSGFRTWEQERNSNASLQSLSLDQRVRRYLRETLETLAY